MTVEKQNGDHLSESPSGRHTYLAEIRVLLMCAPLEGKGWTPESVNLVLVQAQFLTNCRGTLCKRFSSILLYFSVCIQACVCVHAFMLMCVHVYAYKCVYISVGGQRSTLSVALDVAILYF